MIRVRVLLVLLSTAISASATTFLVPADRKLVMSARAIVVASAISSQGRSSPTGGIETATALRVEESIRGPLTDGATFEVVELGGVVADTGLLISGAARFKPGERVLLFLTRDSDGRWRPFDMTLGKFSFVRADDGRELLLRDAREICGWDEDGTWHREPHRDAAGFLRFVRETARGDHAIASYLVPPPVSIRALEPRTDATIGSYLFSDIGLPPRWNTFPTSTVFQSNGTQPGAPGGGITAARRGLGVWTDEGGSNVVLIYGGSGGRSSAFLSNDGVNSIVFNDPSGEITGSYPEEGVLAIGGPWIRGIHQYGGESFSTIVEGDLVVQDGITGRGLTTLGFEHVLAHELGHTLGFRHSDEVPPGGTFSATALMASTVDFDFDTTGAALQAWDIEAVRAVYGSGGPPPPPCTPPSIVTQPQSVVLAGGSVSLSVQATGTTPLSYQWYEGSRGDTRTVVANGTAPVISVQPATTRSYWVRVTGPCAPTADSAAATVTVNGCPAVVITSRSPDVSILEGTTETISVSVNSGGHPVTYKWYEGERGNAARLISTEASITVTPSVSTPYWVQVTNDCGATASSDTVHITVRPCTAPRVVLQPSNTEAVFGKTASLAATISGTGPMTMQWYEGLPLDTSRPLSGATTASVTTPQLFASATYWLHASNECGAVDTAAATVTVVAQCTAPVITVEPRSQNVVPGTSAILTVTATGPSLNYRWYQGPVFDFTRPIGGSAPALATNPINEPTEFWVLVENPCGKINSARALVTPSNPKRRAVGR